MQRCPYIHEMKERLLGTPGEMMPLDALDSNRSQDAREQANQDSHVGTIVKLNSDGYGSHTSPTHAVSAASAVSACTPLMSRCGDAAADSCAASCDNEDGLSSHRCPVDSAGVAGRSNRAPKNAKTSLFIIMSFIYAKLLVVICIAYVISDVITHNLPLYYYEGFFTYLYGMSILFLLYVFCFLLQESACCNGSPPKPKPPPKEKKLKKEKEKKNKEKEKEKEKETKKDQGKKKGEKDKEKDKDKDAGKEKHGKEAKKQSQFQEVYPRKMRDIVREQQLRTAPIQQDIVEVESAITPRICRKRKTTQNDHSHGSFFLRIGAIAFGLGTMIYNGLEFGTFFEVPFESPCYQILRGVNPVLQMVFTFMQMYFIFMNSRLNIHRFKVVARFGLMHVVATNLCVWIRTLVIESLKEITAYHTARGNKPEDGIVLESIRLHTLLNAGRVTGQEIGGIKAGTTISPSSYTLPTTVRSFAAKAFNVVKTTAAIPTTPSTTTSTLYPPYLFGKTPSSGLVKRIKNILPSTQDPWFNAQPDPIDPWANDDPWTTPKNEPPFATTPPPLNALPATIYSTLNAGYQWVFTTISPLLTTSTQSPATTKSGDVKWHGYPINNNLYEVYNEAPPRTFAAAANTNATDIFEALEPLSEALVANNSPVGAAQNCGRVNIMGTIVQDSAPYLYPFIIEYSLIGAAVIYVMWKHIGRHPRLVGEAELERRFEAVVARRAAALAQARRGNRVDCAGASKGLFCGLLLLVAALICLILFFVLVRHPRLGLLAIYLADVSHCALMALSILAIIIGFIRVQGLKFRSEDQSDLNDILLRVSAFGLFIYAVFSVIAGSLGAFTNEPNLLVMITGVLSVIQVVLQLLFIADVSRRRVHLPEQERSKPARQVVTFLLICNVTMWLIYTFEAQKVVANPVQLDFYGFLAWSIVQRVTLPLCIFHRFHSAVTLAEIWKTSYKARLE